MVVVCNCMKQGCQHTKPPKLNKHGVVLSTQNEKRLISHPVRSDFVTVIIDGEDDPRTHTHQVKPCKTFTRFICKQFYICGGLLFATHGNFLISTTIKVIGVFQPPSTLVTKDNHHVRPLMSFRLIRVKIIA